MRHAQPPGEYWTVAVADAGVRLDKWLADPARLGSRSVAADALLRGRVWLNEVEQTPADGATRLRGGERVRVWRDRPGSASRQGPRRAGVLDLVFEDRDLIVVNKPAGLLTVPLPARHDARSLTDAIANHWRSHRGVTPLAVHRLDRDTSGLVVFARTPRAQAALRDQFASRTPERVYLAVVYGWPTPAKGTWRTWLSWDPAAKVQRAVAPHASRGYEARAQYQVVETYEAASLIEVRLHTGKQHQIRAQAWLNGHPLVGERRYVGPPAPAIARPIDFPRQALHATRLGFKHPVSGDAMLFDARPPGDFRDLLAALRRGNETGSRS